MMDKSDKNSGGVKIAKAENATEGYQIGTLYCNQENLLGPLCLRCVDRKVCREYLKMSITLSRSY